MNELLFLAHRPPYPPNKGDKIRSWHLLEFLARHYRIHLGCFVDSSENNADLDRLRATCDTVHFARLEKLQSRVRAGAALLKGQPITLSTYRDNGLMAWAQEIVAREQVRVIFIYSSAMAQYAQMDRALPQIRVMDFVDVDSEKWAQYATRKAWPLSWLYRREARELRQFEQQTAERCDINLFVSEPEADLFRQIAPKAAPRVHSLRNGVDLEYFALRGEQAQRAFEDGPTLVFTGTMNYWPNEDAVCWFAEAVFPIVRRQRPQARFVIVGAAPGPGVRRLAKQDGVTVTGQVPDVRPYLSEADVVVVPLRIACGVQNKVLEAMAMGKAIVATPQGATGLDLNPEKEYLSAETAADFAKAIETLGDSAARQSLGAAARSRVCRDYDWSSALSPLQRLIAGAKESLSS